MNIRAPKLIGLISAGLCLSALAHAEVETLSAKDAYIMVQKGELVLLDVRSPTEWAMTGVPQDSRTASSTAPDFLAQARGAVYGDLDQPVAVICRTGARSADAAKRLEAEGFSTVYDIPEGMAGGSATGEGWLVSGLPTDPFIPRAR